MKYIEIECNTCNKNFQKEIKEIKRRLKVSPQCKFYCSLSCSGKQNAKQLISFADDRELHRKAILAGKGKNIKYFGIDKTMAEHLRRCRQRNKECTITLEHLSDIWKQQQGRCAISNIPLDLTATDYIQMLSVDRIDSSKGYIIGNVHFVSCALNLAKSTMPINRMHDLLALICNNYKFTLLNDL